MYDLKPIGSRELHLCTNTSCMLNGACQNLAHLHIKLGSKSGETTKHGRITLREVDCQGACYSSPMLEAGKVSYESLTLDKANKMIDFLVRNK